MVAQVPQQVPELDSSLAAEEAVLQTVEPLAVQVVIRLVAAQAAAVEQV